MEPSAKIDQRQNEEGYEAHHVDLNANVSGQIENPLANIPRSILLSQVEEFAKEKDLVEYTELLKKGALVAQDPTSFESISGEFALSETEIQDLNAEITHKWRHPRTLYFTIILCSIGAAVQGWDQTGSNGANLSFPDVFGIG
ncbi:hypothetical protein F66182_16618, partial [Fusarium sp. NRRL 66182]